MATVAQAFQTLKSNLEITDLQAETVSTRQKSIRSAMDNGLTVVEDFLTGSYRRDTLIAPLKEADVDIFCILSSSYYQQDGQAALLEMVKQTLRKTYPKTPDISRNGQAVTISFSDFKADVVPAFQRKGGGYLIPNSINYSWISTDPKQHVAIFSHANATHNGNLVPLLKMIKAWNKTIGQHFRSFHLEVMALQILDGVTISNFPSGIRYFFDKGREKIQYQTKDPAGFDGDIGSYIATKAQIQDAIEKFQAAYTRAITAEDYERRGYTSQAFQKWKEVFGDYFPNQ